MSVHGEKIVADLLERIEPGAHVVTNDGKEIGKVSAVEHMSIKIGAALSRDYWIKGTYLVSYDDGVVTTSFDKADLNVYKMEEAVPLEDLGEEPIDAVIPKDEQLETRRHMEEELARQRAEREQRQRRSA
jgi:hypothetical protein